LYAPTMVYIDERFTKKKGLAFGIMWSGVTVFVLSNQSFSLITLRPPNFLT